MVKHNYPRAWDHAVSALESKRSQKPRMNGLTMIIDKGLALLETRGLLEVSADYIDYWKIAFGSSVLYPTSLLREKISLIRAHGIHVYPGGTLFELAAYQGQLREFYQRAKDLGFTAVEVSEGTVDLPATLRKAYIKRSIEEGFNVLSEVGKKDSQIIMEPDFAIEQIASDLETGSYKVIIEGRDSGKGVGIFSDSGDVKVDLLDAILNGVVDLNDLIIEAPQTSQQNYLLTKLGANVNLGNIQPEDVTTLESTRMGLRGDTLRNLLKTSKGVF